MDLSCGAGVAGIESGQSEVQYFHILRSEGRIQGRRSQLDVFRFQVPVDQTMGMGVDESIQQALGDGVDVRPGQAGGMSLQAIAQPMALDEFHHQGHEPILFQNIVQGHEVGMQWQAHHGSRLVDEGL